MLPLNFTAIFLAGIAAFVVGFLIHGPIAGKLWMKLAKIHPTGKEKLSDMVPQMSYNLLMNFLSAYVLAAVYLFASTSPFMGGSGAWNGVVCAFWVWLGFVVTSTSMDVIWMGRSAKLWMFELVSSLITYGVMGAIIASF
jgi:hypothetical protein